MFIFDSGIGGLSILNNIQKKLPKKKYIYMIDNQAFPYGNKKESFIIERSINIIKKIKKKYPITIVIVACNTASTVSLSILKKKFKLPIIGIFPEVKTAQKITKNKVIGLIATESTINSFYIKSMMHKNSIYKNIQIIATNELAKIAEKKARGIITPNSKIQTIFQPWLNLLVKPDTIILGCTHFLLLKEDIKKFFHKSTVFIDGNQQIVKYLERYFHKKNVNQYINKNIFLYSYENDQLSDLLCYLKKYNFEETISFDLEDD